MSHNQKKMDATPAKMIGLAALALLLCIAPAEAALAEPKLLMLAREYFNGKKETKFTGASRVGEKFFLGVATGDPNKFSDSSGEPNDFANVAKWPAVKADWIFWLCTDPDASKLVPTTGVNVSGARIEGTLYLQNVHVPFGVSLEKCAFTEDLFL